MLRSVVMLYMNLFLIQPFAAAYYKGVTLGLCLPNVCTEHDVKEILQIGKV